MTKTTYAIGPSDDYVNPFVAPYFTNYLYGSNQSLYSYDGRVRYYGWTASIGQAYVYLTDTAQGAFDWRTKFEISFGSGYIWFNVYIKFDGSTKTARSTIYIRKTNIGIYDFAWSTCQSWKNPGVDVFPAVNPVQFVPGVQYELSCKSFPDGSLKFLWRYDTGDDSEEWFLIMSSPAGYVPTMKQVAHETSFDIMIQSNYSSPQLSNYFYYNEMSLEADSVKLSNDGLWNNICGFSLSLCSVYGRFLPRWGYQMYFGIDLSYRLGELISGSLIDFMSPIAETVISDSYGYAYLELTPGGVIYYLDFSNVVATGGDIEINFYCDYNSGPLTFDINGIHVEIGLLDELSSSRRIGIRIGGDNSSYPYIGVSVGLTANPYLFKFTITGTHCILEETLALLGILYSESNFLGGYGDYNEYRCTNFKYRCHKTNPSYVYFRYLDIAADRSIINSVLERGEIEKIKSTFTSITTAPEVMNSGYFIHKTELTGGGSNAVDGINPLGIDGSVLQLTAGSTVMVVTDTDEVYLYRAYNIGGQSENLPNYIIPDINPGNWYWKLVKVKAFRPAKMTQYQDLYIGGSYDYDYYGDLAIMSTINSALSNRFTVTTFKITPSSGIETYSQTTGKSNVLCLPHIPIKVRT